MFNGILYPIMKYAWMNAELNLNLFVLKKGCVYYLGRASLSAREGPVELTGVGASS